MQNEATAEQQLSTTQPREIGRRSKRTWRAMLRYFRALRDGQASLVSMVQAGWTKPTLSSYRRDPNFLALEEKYKDQGLAALGAKAKTGLVTCLDNGYFPAVRYVLDRIEPAWRQQETISPGTQIALQVIVQNAIEANPSAISVVAEAIGIGGGELLQAGNGDAGLPAAELLQRPGGVRAEHPEGQERLRETAPTNT
jgi:hypothetical protein